VQYAADTTLAVIPSLTGLTDTARQQILDDAGRLLTYIKTNPWVTDDALSSYGERNSFPLDRMNLARQFLLDTGRISCLNDASMAA